MSVGHQMNIKSHETRFGKLGYPQNGQQKSNLAEANSQLNKELTPEQKKSRDAAIKEIETKKENSSE